MPAETPKRDARWERTRQNLLEGGRQVFADAGLEATSVQDIVRAAGVSQPSFYNHFATKDELALEIVAEHFRNDRRVKQAVFDEVSDPAEAIAINVGQTLSVASNDPVIAWVLVRSESLRNLMLASQDDPLARMIAAGVAAGRFSALSPQTVALAIRGAAFAMVQELLRGDATADIEPHFQELVLRMLGLDPQEASRVVVAARKRTFDLESATG